MRAEFVWLRTDGRGASPLAGEGNKERCSRPRGRQRGVRQTDRKLGVRRHVIGSDASGDLRAARGLSAAVARHSPSEFTPLV